MTCGAKEVGPVRRNPLLSATNNYIDEAQSQPCYFASNLPSCVAREAALIRFQKFNSPGGEVRRMTIICGR